VFYRQYFKEKSKLDWDSAKAAARAFLPLLDAKCPHLVDEMKGALTSLPVSRDLAETVYRRCAWSRGVL
jgi:hypothetical protein